MFVKYFLIASIFLYGANALFGNMKNVTVMGNLRCGNGAAKDVVVELWEDDTVLGIGSDDMLNVTRTDYSGRFVVYGQKRELLNIEPYILIKHQCSKSLCNITDRRVISERYLGGKYDIGYLELGPEREGREKSCN